MCHFQLGSARVLQGELKTRESKQEEKGSGKRVSKKTGSFEGKLVRQGGFPRD